jgi:peroxiredoxin Q/BCP
MFPGDIHMSNRHTRAGSILVQLSSLLLLFIGPGGLWAGPGAGFASAATTVGAEAPAFRLQDQEGQWHNLADYRGKWVVLYFYPKDGTPGCTTQACGFRDNIFAFRQLGATILGISVDDVDSHRKFSAEHHLPFTILADPDKKVTREYGVSRKFMGVMELANRETFLIDPQGRIAKHYPSVDPKEHSQEVIKDLKVLIKPQVPAGSASS